MALNRWVCAGNRKLTRVQIEKLWVHNFLIKKNYNYFF